MLNWFNKKEYKILYWENYNDLVKHSLKHIIKNKFYIHLGAAYSFCKYISYTYYITGKPKHG